MTTTTVAPNDEDKPRMCPDGNYGYAINMTELAPLDWAVPLYGYVMPILVIFTTTTNLFIVIVLSQKHLRTPTNFVLMAMALTDLLTGWTSIPWFVFYYTLDGYKLDEEYGIDSTWCHNQWFSNEIIPSIFHTTTMWLTVFLAVQRYVYVCVPNAVHLYCTPRTTRMCVFGLLSSAAGFNVFTDILAKYRYWEKGVNGTRSLCYSCHYPWVTRTMGMDLYYQGIGWAKGLMHFTPCALLLIFTRKLAQTIKAAEVRKRSWATDSMFDRRGSLSPRCTVSSSGRSMYATNRMLAVICFVFFLLEIPAGFICAMQLLSRFFQNLINPDVYFNIINRFLIMRTLAIIISSPIQFFIYCSMSEQFRLTARQLFTSRLLFVAQAQATFHGGKRYSLILVDVETFEAKRKQSAVRKNLIAKAELKEQEEQQRERRSSVILPAVVTFQADTHDSSTAPMNNGAEPRPVLKRKVGRQVSFPDEDRHDRERMRPFTQHRRSTLRRSSLSRSFMKSSKTIDIPSVVEPTVADDQSTVNLPIGNGLVLL